MFPSVISATPTPGCNCTFRRPSSSGCSPAKPPLRCRRHRRRKGEEGNRFLNQKPFLFHSRTGVYPSISGDKGYIEGRILTVLNGLNGSPKVFIAWCRNGHFEWLATGNPRSIGACRGRAKAYPLVLIALMIEVDGCCEWVSSHTVRNHSRNDQAGRIKR